MKRISISVLILCTCFVSVAWGRQPAGRANAIWSEFHRPNMERSDPDETVLNVNNVGNLALNWSYAAAAAVTSSPAVVNGVVYVGSPADDDAKQEMEKIKADWGAWKDLRRELAASYVTNADRIRLALCDGDEEQIQSRVEDAEKSAKGNVQSGYEKLAHELDELIDRASKYESDGTVGEDARKWRGVMRGAKTRLDRVLKDGGILQGTDNAKVRARIEIGIKKHKEYQENSSRCTASEVNVSSGRIDCVKVDSGYCNIIEIKPNNDKAVAKGWDQVKRYQSDVLDAWRNAGDDKTKIRPEVFGSCIDSGHDQELRLKTDVVTYDFCPVPNEDIDSMIEEQIQQSKSTEDE